MSVSVNKSSREHQLKSHDSKPQTESHQTLLPFVGRLISSSHFDKYLSSYFFFGISILNFKFNLLLLKTLLLDQLLVPFRFFLFLLLLSVFHHFVVEGRFRRMVELAQLLLDELTDVQNHYLTKIKNIITLK